MPLNEQLISRRRALALAGSAAVIGLSGKLSLAAGQTSAPASSAPVTATMRNKRFKVAGDDLFLNNRQKTKAFSIAQKAGLDGVAVDMGSMSGGKALTNRLRDPAVRQEFLDASRTTGVEISAMAFFALYAWVFPNADHPDEILAEWVNTMVQMNVKVGFMPLMAPNGTLAEQEHAEVWQKTVALFKGVAPQAEKAGVILGIESNLDGDGYKRFLDAVGSPNVQAYYNPGRGLEFKYDAYKDIRDLGKDRICALHLEQGSVPPENFEHRLGDGLIDFKKLPE
jgi:sugar phosphate isomerase/epimerase